MKKYCEGVWVWTNKAESMAQELNLNPRIENTPAYIGYEKLGQYAPLTWCEKGYVKEAN